MLKIAYFYDSKNRTGFTLIELLVVIAIIGLLSTLAVVSLQQARQKARDARRVSDIKQITKALELYYSEKGYYPQYIANLRCNMPNSLNSLITEGIIPAVPIDPKNTSTPNPRYCYEYLGIGTAVNYSFSSGWYCSGHSRTDYKWSIQFSTESVTFDFPRLTSSNGVPLNEYIYCLHGALR